VVVVVTVEVILVEVHETSLMMSDALFCETSVGALGVSALLVTVLFGPFSWP